MRDLAKRRALAERLRWLVGGRITNDAFEDFLYDEGCFGSADRTIDEITWWAWTLYSDTRTYRLVGAQRVGRQTRDAAVRAIVLLRGGQDYRWPTLQEPFVVFTLRALAHNWWLPTAALLACALYNYGLTIRGIMLGPLLLIGVMALGSGFRACGSVADRLMRPRREAFLAAGDKECWPFLSREEVHAAANQGHLLAR